MRVFLNIILYIVILLVQVLLLNHINLLGYATPFLYIWLILRLPYDMPKGLVISIGFLTGLIVDIFCNTPGMHALSTTIIAYVRLAVLFLFVQPDDVKNTLGGISSIETSITIRYYAITTLLYCLSLYVIESFSLFNFVTLIIKILSSSLLTIIMILGMESLSKSN